MLARLAVLVSLLPLVLVIMGLWASGSSWEKEAAYPFKVRDIRHVTVPSTAPGTAGRPPSTRPSAGAPSLQHKGAFALSGTGTDALSPPRYSRSQPLGEGRSAQSLVQVLAVETKVKAFGKGAF